MIASVESVGGLGAADPGLLWIAGLAFVGTSLCGALAWRAALRASGRRCRRRRVGALRGRVRRQRHRAGSRRLGAAGRALRPRHEGRLLDGRRCGGRGRRHPHRLARRADRDRQRRRRAPALAAVRDRAIVAGGSGRRRRLASTSRCRAGSSSCWPLSGLSPPRRVISRSSPAGRSPAPPPRSPLRRPSSAPSGSTNPLRAALVLVPAVELAAVLPITPGNVGLASAAVALALGSQGVDSKTALSAGIAFGAVELLTGMAIGAAGALALAGPSARPYLRVATAAPPQASSRSRSARPCSCPLSEPRSPERASAYAADRTPARRSQPTAPRRRADEAHRFNAMRRSRPGRARGDRVRLDSSVLALPIDASAEPAPAERLRAAAQRGRSTPHPRTSAAASSGSTNSRTR